MKSIFFSFYMVRNIPVWKKYIINETGILLMQKKERSFFRRGDRTELEPRAKRTTSMVDRVGAVTAATDQLARATGGPTSADGVEEGESSTPASNIDASTRGVERGGAVAAAARRAVQPAGAAGAPAGARARTGSRAQAHQPSRDTL